MSSSRNQRVREIADGILFDLAKQADKMFAVLMILQWIVAILFSELVTPKTWYGRDSATHIHTYAAVVIGAILTPISLWFIKFRPGQAITRHIIAVSQILYGALFIHLTSGRIETHFHIFGSLAFLSIYRDWRPLITASLVTTVDHLVRGMYFSESVYGVVYATPWRALEHTSWVIFEDLFLIYSIIGSRIGIYKAAEATYQLESHLKAEEEKVKDRTARLQTSQEIILAQQETLVASAKQSALGEMAGQIAHEINTPLGAIVLTAQGLRKKAQTSAPIAEDVAQKMDFILQITSKLSRIINSMRKLAGHSAHEALTEVTLQDLLEDTLLICEGRFKKAGIDFKLVNQAPPSTRLQCRSHELAQVLVNLLNNAHDAVKTQKHKWIQLEVSLLEGKVHFRLSDSGSGIPSENIEKIFLPRFTTKSLDSGTGFGLSICKKLVEGHYGRIFVDSDEKATTFVIELPLEQGETLAHEADQL